MVISILKTYQGYSLRLTKYWKNSSCKDSSKSRGGLKYGSNKTSLVVIVPNGTKVIFEKYCIFLTF